MDCLYTINKITKFEKLSTINWMWHYIVQMFLGSPSLPGLFSSLMLPASDDDFDEDSDDEDEEETAGDRLLMRGSRRRRHNRRRSGLSRHNMPWPTVEPRGFFPRYVTNR